MILNHSKTIRSVISLLCSKTIISVISLLNTVGSRELSRDITLIIVLLATQYGYSTVGSRVLSRDITLTIIPRNGTERNGIFRGIILRNGTPKVPRYIL